MHTSKPLFEKWTSPRKKLKSSRYDSKLGKFGFQLLFIFYVNWAKCLYSTKLNLANSSIYFTY